MVKTLPSNAGGAGSIPGRGAKIPHASQPKNQSIKQKQYCNAFKKDFKKMVHIKKKKSVKTIKCFWGSSLVGLLVGDFHFFPFNIFFL